MAGDRFDAAARYRQSAAVALRPETFGALAYHYGTRRLVFLRSPRLIDAVRRLERSASARSALVAAGVGEPEWPAYDAALAGLLASGVIDAS